MSVFDVTKNKAICVLPWVHEFRGIGKGVKPCCKADSLLPGETMETIREDMLQGKQPSACSNCYKIEHESNYSPRIQETTEWLKKFGAPDEKQTECLYADIRFDNTCNLKCKTCGPTESTLWQKEKGIRIPINEEHKDYLDNLDLNRLKKLYLAGGEPTYIKKYLELLQKLTATNKDCEIIVNTNLKKLPEAWKYLMEKTKQIVITCSCDAIKELGSYVRYPVQWDEFESNVKFASETAPYFMFNIVASNLTTHKIHDTCTWMNQYTKNIHITRLRSPDYFSEAAVPMEHRQTYINSLDKLLSFPVSIYQASNFRGVVRQIIEKYKHTPYDPVLHEKLRAELTEQDSHRSLKLQDIDPFLHSWIYA